MSWQCKLAPGESLGTRRRQSSWQHLQPLVAQLERGESSAYKYVTRLPVRTLHVAACVVCSLTDQRRGASLLRIGPDQIIRFQLFSPWSPARSVYRRAFLDHGILHPSWPAGGCHAVQLGSLYFLAYVALRNPTLAMF